MEDWALFNNTMVHSLEEISKQKNPPVILPSVLKVLSTFYTHFLPLRQFLSQISQSICLPFLQYEMLFKMLEWHINAANSAFNSLFLI